VFILNYIILSYVCYSFIIEGRGFNMTNSIIVIRHAQAKEGSPDISRPISENGRMQAKNCAALLQENHKEFDLLITSSATRAKNTAEVILQELKQLPKSYEIDRLYQLFNPEDKNPADNWSTEYEEQTINSVKEILAKHQPKEVLIVAHMRVINSIGLALAFKSAELKNAHFSNCEGFEIVDGNLVNLIKNNGAKYMYYKMG
jgi:phosphohistidine phosphatase SixA